MPSKTTKWESTLTKWINWELFYSNLDDTFSFTSLLSYIIYSVSQTWQIPQLVHLPHTSFKAIHHWHPHTHPPCYLQHTVPNMAALLTSTAIPPTLPTTNTGTPCYLAGRPWGKGFKAGPLNPSAATLHPHSALLTSSPIGPMIKGRPGALFMLAWCAYQS